MAFNMEQFALEVLEVRRPANGGPDAKASLGWFPVSKYAFPHDAQGAMRDFRKAYPNLPVRVVECETRRLLLCYDPRKSA